MPSYYLDEPNYNLIIEGLRKLPTSKSLDLIIDKLSDKLNKRFSFEITESEFFKILEVGLEREDDAFLREVLNTSLARDFEANIKKYFCSLIQEKSKLKFVKTLLECSEYLKDNIFSFRGVINSHKFGIAGSTILQGAILAGNTDVVEYLISEIPDFKFHNDYYDNNCLHYAAASGDDKCYQFIKNLNSDYENQSNIFGHKPNDYFFKDLAKLTKIDQNHLIRQFRCFLRLDSRDDSINESGLCYGISFVTALYILRGGSALAEYQKMLNVVATWDQKLDSLDSVRESFDYLFNCFFYFYNFQNPTKSGKLGYNSSSHQSNIDISRADRSRQLAYINPGQDQVSSRLDCSIDGLSRSETKKILEEQLMPNTIVTVSLGCAAGSINFLDDRTARGHEITFVVDKNDNLYFCDPNSPYFPIPISKEKINLLIDIMYKYYDNIKNIGVYDYENVASKKEKHSTVTHINNDTIKMFLASRKGSEYHLMQKACEADSPYTLESVLISMQPLLTDENLKRLVRCASINNSYQCLEILVNYHATSKNVPIAESLELLEVEKEGKQNFYNYLANKI